MQNLGFNSQRDGILRRRKNYFHRAKIVSIPNGMEFYAPRAVFGYLFAFVSIPNGMEFYSCRPQNISAKFSFNSQRDGILPRFASALQNFIFVRAFQFPTGWNST